MNYSGKILDKTYNKLRKCERVMLVGAIAPHITHRVSPGCLPFGAMALSSFLKQHNIQCKVVSTAFPEAVYEIFNDIDNFDLLGISSMSGPYLGYAILIAENVKKIRPELPIVWGGPHASLMDEDLISMDFVDFVIRGVGENALLRFVRALEGQQPFSSVPGLTWIESGCIKRNNPDLGFDINEFPPLDYSLLSNRYSAILNKEFSYFSSRGCPFNCSYCVSSQLYNRRWYNKSEDKIVNELKRAYSIYKYKSVFFWDDTLFVDIQRLCDILSKLNSINIHFQWSGFCRADIFSRLDSNIIRELKERGLKWLSIGAESGSQKVLDKINKGITVDNIKQTAIKLKKWNISCDFSFMGGILGETVDDFYKSLDLIKWIKDNHPNASTRLYRFIPYPKMPILNHNKEINRFLPRNIYEWSKITYQSAHFSWIPKKINRALNALAASSMYAQKPKLSLLNILIVFLYYLIQFRIKTKFFFFHFEGWIVERGYTNLSLKLLNNFKRKITKINKYLQL